MMESNEKKYAQELAFEIFEANFRQFLFKAVAEYSPEFDATTGDQTEKTIYYINLCDRLVSSRLDLEAENFEDIQELVEMVVQCYQEEFDYLEHSDDLDEDFLKCVEAFRYIYGYVEENEPEDEWNTLDTN